MPFKKKVQKNFFRLITHLVTSENLKVGWVSDSRKGGGARAAYHFPRGFKIFLLFSKKSGRTAPEARKSRIFFDIFPQNPPKSDRRCCGKLSIRKKGAGNRGVACVFLKLWNIKCDRFRPCRHPAASGNSKGSRHAVTSPQKRQKRKAARAFCPCHLVTDTLGSKNSLFEFFSFVLFPRRPARFSCRQSRY